MLFSPLLLYAAFCSFFSFFLIVVEFSERGSGAEDDVFFFFFLIGRRGFGFWIRDEGFGNRFWVGSRGIGDGKTGMGTIWN